jgi:hypothetical protein
MEKEKIQKILRESRNIAVVGCSRNRKKHAHKIPKYLKEHGYRIIPVNPFADEILGEKSYSNISDVKEPVDIVDIFRPSKECLAVVKHALKVRPKVIWMQLGIRNEEAKELAKRNGIEVVMDKCIMKEHKHLAENKH